MLRIAAAIAAVVCFAASDAFAQANCSVYGPYATMRRANEVANYARRSGYFAVPYHNGDGYYVRVCAS